MACIGLNSQATINLSILDFKQLNLFEFELNLNSINLSILDFKQLYCPKWVLLSPL